MGTKMIKSHDGDAATLEALKTVLASMRWNDIEAFALKLEEWRRGGEKKPSKRRLSAEDVVNWATDGGAR